MRLWFGGEQDTASDVAARDAALAERFLPYTAARAGGKLDDWGDSGRGRLALILLTDQFPRNIHRGSAEAFAQDSDARGLCLRGLDLGHDRDLGLFERVFFYMPLEHSESLEDQQRSVLLFTRLEQDAPEVLREAFSGFTRYAVLHRDIVQRFGRFPHRNRVLGRANTEAESAYLAGDSPSFGQR
jgi:uncharacterized protein (DUF924 family)